MGEIRVIHTLDARIVSGLMLSHDDCRGKTCACYEIEIEIEIENVFECYYLTIHTQ